MNVVALKTAAPVLTATMLHGTDSLTLTAVTAPDAEALDALVEDARRYGRLSADVVEMARMRHADLAGELSDEFSKAAGQVLDIAEGSALPVTLSLH